ncbi:MAG: GNAT family N-acetyltransferase [Clostridia bacterium]|nr:GNAT family N-acetyltransferase [Clostridia bacterium]
METKRLRICPATRDQMETFVAAEPDGELKKAYTEMLSGCLQHPDQWQWDALWMIGRKDGTHVGDLCFRGPGQNGAVEIGYGIVEEHRCQDYAAEMVDAAVDWALRQPGITCVEAETESGNHQSRRVLEKCGFCPAGMPGKEGLRFSGQRIPCDQTDGEWAFRGTGQA